MQFDSFLQGGLLSMGLCEQRRARKPHSRLFTLFIPGGWDWEAEKSFPKIFTLLYCLACFHEQVILKVETKV